MKFDDEFERELRQGERDEYLADQDFDRRLHEHNCGLCDSDHCKFCDEEEKAIAAHMEAEREDVWPKKED